MFFWLFRGFGVGGFCGGCGLGLVCLLFRVFLSVLWAFFVFLSAHGSGGSVLLGLFVLALVRGFSVSFSFGLFMALKFGSFWGFRLCLLGFKLNIKNSFKKYGTAKPCFYFCPLFFFF